MGNEDAKTIFALQGASMAHRSQFGLPRKATQGSPRLPTGAGRAIVHFMLRWHVSFVSRCTLNLNIVCMQEWHMLDWKRSLNEI